MTIADGTYRARALGGEFGYTQGNNEQVAVLFALLGDDDAETGERITWFGYFTEKTQQRTLEALRYCGWTGNDLTDLVSLGSTVVEIVVEAEEYNDKWQAKVKWVNRPGGGAVKLAKPMGDKEKRAFAARFKNMAAAIPTVGATPAKAPAAKPPARTAPQPRRDPDPMPSSADWGPPNSEEPPF